MKEAFKVLLCSFLISHLALAPLQQSLVFAQSKPVISHRSVKMAQAGKNLNIIAHISDPESIQKVSLAIISGGKTIKGKLPRIQKTGTFPVLVQVKKNRAPVYSGSDAIGSPIARPMIDETLYVTAVKNGMLRVHQTDGFSGYISPDDVSIKLTGGRYGVAIPAQFTSNPDLSYFIEVVDINGNTQRTPEQAVRLISPQELASMQGGQDLSSSVVHSSSSAKRPFYKKLWFWFLVIVTAGGAAYFLTQGDDETEQAEVQVFVEWN